VPGRHGAGDGGQLDEELFLAAPGADQDDQALNRHLGGTNNLFVLVKGAAADAIKEPRTLLAIDELQRFIERQPHVGKTISIAELRQAHAPGMNGDDPAFNAVPASRELISQYLLLYAMSGEPGDFDTYVDYGYRLANVTVYLKSDSSARSSRRWPSDRALRRRRFGPDVKVSIGGGLGRRRRAQRGDGEGQDPQHRADRRGGLRGGQPAVPLARRRRAGAAAAAMAVLATFGMIGWAGIPLNVSTSLISAMAVGIGADYAIYLIYRIREELATGSQPAAAVRRVLATAGKAVLLVALAVSPATACCCCRSDSTSTNGSRS
jgi:predicted RND superfamily exporter protein